MRIIPTRRNACFAHRPFQGNTVGVSLYASDPGGDRVVYRNRRIVGPGQLVALGVKFPLGGTNVKKTTAIGSATSPATSIAVPVDASWHSQTVLFNVRTHECDVENETLDGARPITFDGSGNVVAPILGTARLITSQKRDNGGWLFTFVYLASSEGLQPTQFALIRTAGPTSPANVTTAFNGARSYTLEVDGLTDAGAYTFKIQASNGATTADLLTGLAITADASGPPAVTGLTAAEY